MSRFSGSDFNEIAGSILGDIQQTDHFHMKFMGLRLSKCHSTPTPFTGGSNTKATGTVTIFTERAACASCLGVIEQFKAKYPSIQVNVLDNNGVLLRPGL